MSLVFDCMYTVGHAQANCCKIPTKTRSKTRWCFCRGIKCSRKSKMNFRVLELKWVKWICDRKFDFYIISSDRDVNDAKKKWFLQLCDCSPLSEDRRGWKNTDVATWILRGEPHAADPLMAGDDNTSPAVNICTCSRRSPQDPWSACPSINRPKTNRVGQLMTTAEIIAPGQWVTEK